MIEKLFLWSTEINIQNLIPAKTCNQVVDASVIIVIVFDACCLILICIVVQTDAIEDDTLIIHMFTCIKNK